MHVSPRLLGLAACAALVLTPYASAQPYFLSARATATGSPDVLDQTDELGFVSAMNSGGNPGPDNPSTVESLAEGGPRSFVCAVTSTAQSLGPAADGFGRARVIAINDELFFEAKVSSTVRVSLGFEKTLSTAWSGDGAVVNFTSPWQVRTLGGTLDQLQQFRYAERDDGEGTTVTADERGPYEFDLEPGETLLMSAEGEASTFVAAEFMVADGAATAELGVTFFIDVIAGDAEFIESVSGNAYGPPPCNLADLTEPYGLLDLADTLVFVTAFQANDPLVDFDNSGLLDLADVVTFVTAFLDDCP